MVLKITRKQSAKVRKLARRECCNCYKGNCLLLDDGEECKCVQLISRYDLRNIVYMKYIEKLKGKPVKDAAISQQRTKFETMLSALYRQQE